MKMIKLIWTYIAPKNRSVWRQQAMIVGRAAEVAANAMSELELVSYLEPAWGLLLRRISFALGFK